MEALKILKLPIEAARFVGRQMLGGGWSELPDLSSGRPVRVPQRVSAAIHYHSTPEIPANIQTGEE